MVCPSSTLPSLQFGATILLGAGAFAVAFMQWRTAHQKVVLDLFKQRHEVIINWRDIGNSYFVDNTIKKQDIVDFRLSCPLLFGDDVAEIMLDLVNKIDKSPTLSFNDPVAAKQFFDIKNDIREEFKPKILLAESRMTRYMRMDQKLARTPAEWFRDVNARRKSYGDTPAP